MAVNALQQPTSTEHNEQEPLSLLSLNSDGSLLVHPAITKQFLPQLLQKAFDPTLCNIGHETKPYREEERSIPEHPDAQPNHYELARIENMRLGRIWSSKVRRLCRKQSFTRYSAMQFIADKLNKPVTDIRRLIELHNKVSKVRGKAIRQAILWKWHCEGSNHRASAVRFPFNIHEKTVASDVADIKGKHL